MKILFKIVLIMVFFIACTCAETKASNVSGADISYTWLGGTKYLITMHGYVNCRGSITVQSLYVYDGSNAIGVNVYTISDRDITPICPGSCTPCNNYSCNFGFGANARTMTATIDVSQFKNCNLLIAWDITNIAATSNITSTNTDLTVETVLNRCNGEHSSPSFDYDPITLLCNGQVHDEYVTASSPEKNDSLVYALTYPLHVVGKRMEYADSFSYLSPMSYPSSPAYKLSKPNGFHYDAHTGEFYFEPVKANEQSFVSFQVNQYMKDINGDTYLAGSVIRTIQLTSITCSANKRPVVSSADISPKSDSIYVCGNQSLTFSVSASDSDKNDYVSLSALNQTHGSISYSSSKTTPKATFTWNVADSEVRQKPWTITFTAKDSKCPMYGATQRRFYIFVKDSLPSVSLSRIDSGCGRYHFGMKKILDKGYPLNYQWLADNIVMGHDSAFSYHTTVAGRHDILLVITNTRSGCSESYKDSIYYDTAYKKLPADTGICKGGSVVLKAYPGKDLSWSPATDISNANAAIVTVNPSKTAIYTVTGTDAAGCIYTDHVKVKVSDFTSVIASSKTNICKNESVKIFNTHLSGVQYTWQPAALITKQTGDSLTTLPQTSTWYYATGTLNGCVKKDSLLITVHNNIVNLGKDTTVCQGDTIRFQVKGGKFYQWNYPDIHLKYNDSIFDFAENYPVNANLRVTYTDIKTGCVDTGRVKVSTYAFSPSVDKKSVGICIKNTSATITASGGENYTWFTPKGWVHTPSYTFTPAADTFERVLITGVSGKCSRNITVPVFVGPFSAAYPDIKTCWGSPVKLKAIKGTYYNWSPASGLSGTSGQTVTANPAKTTAYSVTIKDSASGCIHTDYQKVNVDADCVMPGDANKDGYANYLDVMYIGLANGETGPARNPQSTKWQSWTGTDWDSTTGNGINYRHMDCNGDGVVDAKDTGAVSQNYNYIQPAEGAAANLPVSLKFAADTFWAGDTVTAWVQAINTTHTFNAYGIGFKVSVSGTPVLDRTATIQPACGFFCAEPHWFYAFPGQQANSFEAAAVRLDKGISTYNSGNLAKIKLVLKDTFGLNYPAKGLKIKGSLSGVRAIDLQGKLYSLNAISDSAIVLKKRTGIAGDDLQAYGVKMYPNPAVTRLFIDPGKAHIRQIIVRNCLGQELMRVPQDADTGHEIDVTNILPGYYMIEVLAAEGVYNGKVLIAR